MSIAAPVLRANVTVSGDLVRIGDVIDNAGTGGADRDLPRAGSRHHRRAAGRPGADGAARASGDRRRHPQPQRDFDHPAGAHAREQGNRARDRPRAGAQERSRRCRQPQPDLRPRRPATCSSKPPTAARMQATRSATIPAPAASTSRLEIANEQRRRAATKLRFTGTAVETVEAAVLARGVERNEVIKASDVVIERRPKAEVGNDAATARPRGRHAGAPAAARRPGAEDRRSRQARSRAEGPGRALIYQAVGLHLTIRGKALEAGTEGDVVNVHEPAIQAHRVRRRHRPRPGLDHRRRRRACPNCPTPPPRSVDPAPVAGRRRQRRLARVSKSRVMVMYASRIHRLILTGALLVTAALASGCSSIDRLSQIGEKPKTVRDRESDGAARLQAGADADAEAGDRLLQRQFIVAQRLAAPSSRISARPGSATFSPSP